MGRPQNPVWKPVSRIFYSDRIGHLYRHIHLPNQWKWRNNTVVAVSQEEAIKNLFSQANVEEKEPSSYWVNIKKKGILIGNKYGHVGALYQHLIDGDLWKFRCLVFKAKSEQEAISKINNLDSVTCRIVGNFRR